MQVVGNRIEKAMALPERTSVLIVGAGPTGLTLAALLAQKGIRALLLDCQSEGANTSRAAVVHARTLEALEELGVTDQLITQGIIVPEFTVRDRDRALIHVSFRELPTKYPYTLMIPQSETEAILLKRLRELGGEVHRPYLLTKLRQEAAHVEAMVANADGVGTRVQAQYLIGCDGMHSAVREQAGFTFAGGIYEQSFVLADVKLKWDLSTTEVMLFLAPQGLVVIAPLPRGHHRVVATLEGAPQHPDLQDVQRLLDARGPAESPARVEEVVWSSRFRVQHRLASSYRIGRVFIAGDAAHVHSPAGGQGMNTGIQDAIALGQALGSVLSGKSAESALDEYERKRRAVAAHVVSTTDRMTRLATLRVRLGRFFRNAVLQVLNHSASFKRNLAMDLSGLRYR
jgi:2-polyprenyl-6-methoxyphenol hydroxylase-like FAD-dependent oxidoreductase